MRLTVLVQGAKGLKHEATRTSVLAALERLKRLLWHGNLFRAFQVLEVLEEAADAEHPAPEEKKVAKWLYDFRQYIEINQPFVSNYGVRYQAGGASPVPLRSRRSTMSSGTRLQVKRMVKQQQMRWTHRGAHLLHQIRTQVLDDQ